MFTWFDYLVEYERRRDERARAEAWRLLNSALRNGRLRPPRRRRRHEIFLASLGNRLVRWGSRLQARYRPVTQTREGSGPDPLTTPQLAGHDRPPLSPLVRGYKTGPETGWRPAGEERAGVASELRFPRDGSPPVS